MRDDDAKIWVGGLPRDIQAQELREAFDKCGNVMEGDEAILIRSGKGDTFAFITFVSERGRQEAIRLMDNSTEFGEPIKVKEYKDRRGDNDRRRDDDRQDRWQGQGKGGGRDRSRERSRDREWDRGGKAGGKGGKGMVEPDCRVWVGGLPKDIGDREVEKEFGRHGTVENVKLCKSDRDTFAFVQFSHPREAASAIKQLDQSSVFGRIMKVGTATRPQDGKGKGKGKGGGHEYDRDDGGRPRDSDRGWREAQGSGRSWDRWRSRSRDGCRGRDDGRARGDEFRRGPSPGPSRGRSRGRSPPPRARSPCEDDRAPIRRPGRPRSDGCKVFVSNLPSDMTREELKTVAADFGRIFSVDIWEERDCNSGTVEFESQAGADKAVKELDGRKVVDWHMKLTCRYKN